MVAPQKEVFTRNLLTSCMLGRVGWLAMFSSSFAAVAKKFGATRRGWLVVAGFGLVSPGAIAQMEVSARQIVFSALTGGDAPAPQSIAVTSDISNQREFTIQIDAAPGQWLSAGPRRAITPARIQLQAHTAGLCSGSYSARVMVQSGATVIPIEVNLSLEDKAPSMDVIPAYVRFQLTESTVSSKQVLYVRNAGGGGSLDFRVSLASNNDWISVSPASGRSEPDRPGLVTVAVDEAKVRAADTAIVQITAGDESRTVPVTVAPPQSGPVLAVNLTGIRLEAGGGGSYSHVRTVPVINLGGGTLHWEAAVISGGEWLQVTPERGTATAEQFGRLLLQAEPSDLSPGVYNALIRVTDQSDGTTPQYVTAALKIGDPDAALSPEPSPAGLFFVGNAGGSEMAPQPILLLAGSTAPVAFQASASTADGGDWLRVEPRTGFTSMHDPQALRVIVDPKRLSSGIYTGDVTVAFANRSIRSTNITLVAPGSTEAAKASQRQQQSVSCVPSSLALTHTGTVNSFAIPAGWPTPVVIRLADNCGGAVSEASMVATFSNGDPPLAMRLTNPRLGIYSATWIPRRGHQRVAATARATSPALGTATAVIIGGVEDEAAASMPLPSGVLSMSGPGLGSVIALGAPVQIFGSNLAKSARAAMSMPCHCFWTTPP